MTNKIIVAIAGDNALADALRSLCRTSGNVKLLGAGEASTREVDIVIETNNLDLEHKRSELTKAESLIRDDALILSTVLGATATQCASWLQHPSRLAGFSAFAAVDRAELIEIAPALQTEAIFMEKARDFFQALGKETETVQDEAGLVFARILSMIVNEAAFALMEGTASALDIDTAMRKGTNYPYGPLEWADELGLDDIYAVLTALQRELGEARYRPAPLLRKMVYAGRIGRRSGQGFYTYGALEVST